MGHSVSQQGKRAGEKIQKAEKVERTPEQILKDIRLNLAAGLSVTPEDTKWLLTQRDQLASNSEAKTANYEAQAGFLSAALEERDQAREQVAQWQKEFDKLVVIRDALVAARDEFERAYKETLAERDKLIEQLAEFRQVYTAENSSMTVTRDETAG